VTLSIPVELVPVECPCGVAFAIPRPLFDERVATQGRVYCPTGGWFRLGLPPRLERHITELTESLREARLVTTELLDANEKLLAEVQTTRRAAIDSEVGSATAEDHP
jgi:hypothetical protein